MNKFVNDDGGLDSVPLTPPIYDEPPMGVLQAVDHPPIIETFIPNPVPVNNVINDSDVTHILDTPANLLPVNTIDVVAPKTSNIHIDGGPIQEDSNPYQSPPIINYPEDRGGLIIAPNNDLSGPTGIMISDNGLSNETGTWVSNDPVIGTVTDYGNGVIQAKDVKDIIPIIGPTGIMTPDPVTTPIKDTSPVNPVPVNTSDIDHDSGLTLVPNPTTLNTNNMDLPIAVGVADPTINNIPTVSPVGSIVSSIENAISGVIKSVTGTGTTAATTTTTAGATTTAQPGLIAKVEAYAKANPLIALAIVGGVAWFAMKKK